MDDWKVDEVIEGIRELTGDERQFMIHQHEFLAEFVGSDDPEQLSDKELVRQVRDAGYEYVKNTFIEG